MVLEHAGITVKNPLETAKWYENNLGCRIVRQGVKGPGMAMAFISDGHGSMLEFISDPSCASTESLIKSAPQLHFAFLSADPFADKDRLVDAGAVYEGEGPAAPGEILLFLTDPFGNHIQLVKRNS